MPNPENLRPVPFTTDNQPSPERKSRKGIPNRATVFKKFLKMKIEIDDPVKIGEKLQVSVYEAAALGQIFAAINGNTAAWKSIQDDLWGKQTERTETSGPGGEPVQTTATFVIIPGVLGNDPPTP